jgi:hypothetical protein
MVLSQPRPPFLAVPNLQQLKFCRHACRHPGGASA